MDFGANSTWHFQVQVSIQPLVPQPCHGLIHDLAEGWQVLRVTAGCCHQLRGRQEEEAEPEPDQTNTVHESPIPKFASSRICMQVYVSVCKYIYAGIHVYIYIHIHIYSTRIYVYTNTNANACIHIHIRKETEKREEWIERERRRKKERTNERHEEQKTLT